MSAQARRLRERDGNAVRATKSTGSNRQVFTVKDLSEGVDSDKVESLASSSQSIVGVDSWEATTGVLHRHNTILGSITRMGVERPEIC